MPGMVDSSYTSSALHSRNIGLLSRDLPPPPSLVSPPSSQFELPFRPLLLHPLDAPHQKAIESAVGSALASILTKLCDKHNQLQRVASRQESEIHELSCRIRTTSDLESWSMDLRQHLMEELQKFLKKKVTESYAKIATSTEEHFRNFCELHKQQMLAMNQEIDELQRKCKLMFREDKHVEDKYIHREHDQESCLMAPNGRINEELQEFLTKTVEQIYSKRTLSIDQGSGCLCDVQKREMTAMKREIDELRRTCERNQETSLRQSTKQMTEELQEFLRHAVAQSFSEMTSSTADHISRFCESQEQHLVAIRHEIEELRDRYRNQEVFSEDSKRQVTEELQEFLSKAVEQTDSKRTLSIDQNISSLYDAQQQEMTAMRQEIKNIWHRCDQDQESCLMASKERIIEQLQEFLTKASEETHSERTLSFDQGIISVCGTQSKEMTVMKREIDELRRTCERNQETSLRQSTKQMTEELQEFLRHAVAQSFSETTSSTADHISRFCESQEQHLVAIRHEIEELRDRYRNQEVFSEDSKRQVTEELQEFLSKAVAQSCSAVKQEIGELWPKCESRLRDSRRQMTEELQDFLKKGIAQSYLELRRRSERDQELLLRDVKKRSTEELQESSRKSILQMCSTKTLSSEQDMILESDMHNQQLVTMRQEIDELRQRCELCLGESKRKILEEVPESMEKAVAGENSNRTLSSEKNVSLVCDMQTHQVKSPQTHVTLPGLDGELNEERISIVEKQVDNLVASREHMLEQFQNFEQKSAAQRYSERTRSSNNDFAQRRTCLVDLQSDRGSTVMLMAGPRTIETIMSEIYIFANLSPWERSAIASRCCERIYAKGDIVVKQDEKGEAFYVVESGKLNILRDDEVISHLDDGSYFGKSALLLGKPHSATVQVVSSVAKLWALNHSDFERFLNDPVLQPKIHMSIMALNTEDVSELRDQVRLIFKALGSSSQSSRSHLSRRRGTSYGGQFSEWPFDQSEDEDGSEQEDDSGQDLAA